MLRLLRLLPLLSVSSCFKMSLCSITSQFLFSRLTGTNPPKSPTKLVHFSLVFQSVLPRTILSSSAISLLTSIFLYLLFVFTLHTFQFRCFLSLSPSLLFHSFPTLFHFSFSFHPAPLFIFVYHFHVIIFPRSLLPVLFPCFSPLLFLYLSRLLRASFFWPPLLL